MPRVSILLCSYNQAEYLEEAIQSALAQTYGDYELIAIDNGSTDASHEILGRYANDPRVRLFCHKDNAAITKRFNEGIAAARGEFASFLYSDDMYLPDKLARQVAQFDALPREYGVVYGAATMLSALTGERWQADSFRESGEVLLGLLTLRARGRRDGNIDMLSPMARTECFRRYPFYEDVFAEGEVSLYKLAMSYRFFFLEGPTVVLRDHAANRGKAVRRNALMTSVCLERLGGHPAFPVECSDALRGARAALWAGLAWTSVRLDEESDWVRTCYRKAIGISWKVAAQPKVIAGCALSILPRLVRRQINGIGHKLRGNLGHRVVVDDYGGSINRATDGGV